MRHGRAVVVGGGIGGLTAVAALRAVGWDAVVVEQARELGPVGRLAGGRHPRLAG